MTLLRPLLPKAPSRFGPAAALSLAVHALAGLMPVVLPRAAPAPTAILQARLNPVADPAPRAPATVPPLPTPAPTVPTGRGPVPLPDLAIPESLAPLPPASTPEPAATPVATSPPPGGPEAATGVSNAPAAPPVVEAAAGASAPMALPTLAVTCHERPAPVYPAASRRRGEEGRVTLRVDLDADGHIVRTAVASSSGSRWLDDAALAAVRAWKCRPANRDGQPIPATAMQPFSFVLNGS